MSKEVAIITLHYSDNYGSVLQAYALQTYLEKNRTINVSIIDYIQKYDAVNYKFFRTELYRKRPQAFLADLLYFGKNRKRKASFESFRKNYLHMTAEKYDSVKQLESLNEGIDGFICGSDQIWNFDCTNGLDPAYFLSFAAADKKKISYAASFGQTQFAIDDIDKVKKYLQTFDLISIREKSMQEVLEREIERPVQVVLDPTLLLCREEYDKLCDENLRKRIEKPYIFVYMLEENLELLKYAKRYAEQTALKLVYISNISKKGQLVLKKYKNAYGVDPGNFLTYIKYAECIITNSFHATVFSVLYEKKFCTFKTKHSFPRMLDLLDNLKLNDRIFDDKFDMNKDIDYKMANDHLEKMRENSYLYLKEIEDLINKDEDRK